MRLDYLVRRLVVFAIVVWAAITISFLVPRTPEIVSLLASAVPHGSTAQANGDHSEGEDGGEPGYYARVFRLDKPLHEQYLGYLGDVARLDLDRSMSHYPKTVREIIGEALPWTVGLLGVSTLLGFGLGSLLGLVLAWPRTPGWARLLIVPLLTLSAVPFYMLGLIFAYFFSVMLHWLPIGGGYPLLMVPGWKMEFVLGVLRHSILPASAITLSSLGFWALGMRAMVVTALGEDFMVLAEAKGLKERTLMLRYAAGNAILPQTTALAISIGNVVAGAVLVEIVFAYPGIGTKLQQAVLQHDLTLMQGITFTLIVSIAIVTLLLDLALPFLDPRIRYGKE